MTALEPTYPARDQVVVVADLDGTLTFDAEPPGPAVTALLHDFDRRPDVRLVLATSRAACAG